MSPDGAAAGKACARALDDAPKLAAGNGQVGGDDDDAASLVRRVLADAPVDFKADGMPADLQVGKAAVVCLREHAEREALALDFKNA